VNSLFHFILLLVLFDFVALNDLYVLKLLLIWRWFELLLFLFISVFKPAFKSIVWSSSLLLIVRMLFVCFLCWFIFIIMIRAAFLVFFVFIYSQITSNFHCFYSLYCCLFHLNKTKPNSFVSGSIFPQNTNRTGNPRNSFHFFTGAHFESNISILLINNLNF